MNDGARSTWQCTKWSPQCTDQVPNQPFKPSHIGIRHLTELEQWHSSRCYRRKHLSTPKYNSEVLASRTVSQPILEESRAVGLPSSPLGSINLSLYPRFPWFSITTESSHPGLSTDDVTSTKISLDEEGMVAIEDHPTPVIQDQARGRNCRSPCTGPSRLLLWICGNW